MFKDKLGVFRKICAILKTNSSILPILNNALIRNGNVELTDLMNYVTIKNAAHNINPFLIDPKQLIAAITYFIDPIITVEESTVKFSDLFASLTFKTDDVGEFPKEMTLDSAASIKAVLSLSDIENLVRAKAFSSNDELRPAMCGVYIGDGEIASTDAHLLYFTPIKSVFNTPIIIKTSFINLLDIFKAGGDYSITHNTYGIIAENSHVKISSRLIDERYPDWRAVLPAGEPTTVVKLPKADLIRDLSLVLTITHPSTKRVAFKISPSENKFELVVNNTEEDKSYAKVFSDVEATGESLEIHFNTAFLIKALRACEANDVEFAFTTCNRAGIINKSILIMPVMKGDFE